MREKRQHHRVAYIVKVQVETASGQHLDVQSQDISQGGIFLRTEDTLPIGSPVTLTLDLPGIDGSHVPGFVRWIKDDGFGVQFGLLGARETHAIGKVVRGAQAS